ncbi:diguanylate cyclase [Rouxiella sp. Mn2063]|uniref:sensor domain-containing diguanylate cyclase n=1 Tax=Rouxiella sp. Mn2063 TaxID=3395262 RepID=UPI003BDDDBF0
MPTYSFFRLDLRRLILMLAVISVLVTLANSLYASYSVQRRLLMNDTLEGNRVYAMKLAGSTNLLLESANMQLSYSATRLDTFNNIEALDHEVDRLVNQSSSFDSALIADSHGKVLSASPSIRHLVGTTLDSPGAKKALELKRPLLTPPYLAPDNTLNVYLSTPVFTKDNQYLGYIVGNIFLTKTSFLNQLLAANYYRDGSYIMVVDDDQRILYHQRMDRIGKIANTQAIFDAAKSSPDGSLEMVNSAGKTMLVGYATMPELSWKVITLSPLDSTLKPLDGLMLSVIMHQAPLTIITLAIVWFLARWIAQPLWLLARSATEMDKSEISANIRKIDAHYFEVTQLKRALLVGISLLNKKIGKLKFEVQTDPMTGLFNRRGLASMSEPLHRLKQTIAILALDIDHFKRINDTFGHDAGDDVIRQVAEQIRACSRESDILCRSGGEEFLVLLLDGAPDVAEQVSERLRLSIERMRISGISPVTISIGVAFWQPNKGSLEAVLKQADEALYQAKQAGRNRVVISQSARN